MARSEHAVPSCLTEDELRRLHAREFSEQELAVAQEHIRDCPDCTARAETLRAEHESWVQQLRSVGPRPADRRMAVSGDAGTIEADQIDGYAIIEELDRGGQGIVYRAMQESTKREVALKILREGIHASPSARRRFEREIELVAGLRHPNIVTVFDSGQTQNGGRFLAMDFVHGLPLGRYVRTETPDLNTLLRLFSRICGAVNAAHQRGVIHRDLKPSNILVSEDAEPHVLDFGLARPVAEPGGAMMTTAGQVAGTLPYMSPEQARGQRDAVDIRSDVYSLGVILYELLTGTFPYPVEGDTIEVLRHIAETTPVPPRRVIARDKRPSATPTSPVARGWRVDDDLQTIVLKALSKEQERRYQTAGELARDVDHYLAREPIEAKRDSSFYLLRKTLQRYPIAAGFAAAFVLLLIVSGITLATMYVKQTHLKEEAQSQARTARAAEEKANRRFNEVRALANFCIQQLDPLIHQLPGSAPARKALVEEGLKYLDALNRDASGDSSMQLELAAAFMTIGDVQGALQSSNLGDFEGALRSYKKASRILEAVLSTEPNNIRCRQIIATNLIRTSDVLGVLGKEEAAVAALRESITRGESWLAQDPNHEALRHDIFAAHGRLGNVLIRRGQVDEAMALQEKTRAMEVALKDEEPNDRQSLHRRVTRHTAAGELLYRRRRFEEALASYRRALEAALMLRETHPDDIIGSRDVAIAYQWLGIICSDLDRHEDAEENYRASITAQEHLLELSPGDHGTMNDVATTLSKLGEAQIALGRREEAAASYRRSLELIEQVVDRRPDFAAAWRLKGVAYYKMAELEKARAEEKDDPLSEPTENLSRARKWLESCLQVFVDMRERGILSAADVGVPDQLETEIAQLDQELQRLSLRETSTAGTTSEP